MGRRAPLAILCTAVLVGGAAADAKKQVSDFSRHISKDDRIVHALNRLTFGPRPGDAADVRKTGLHKWIERQLHPDRIPENPALEARLHYLDTLRMSSAEIVRNYPTPQAMREMAAGRMPFPDDPAKRKTIERLAARARRNQGQDAEAAPAASPRIDQVLSRAQIRTLRAGSPEERVEALKALPPEKLDEVISALPGGARLGLAGVAGPELRRRIVFSAAPAQLVARDLMEAKLLRAIYSNRQLEEVLTDFWFNHFNVFLDKGADRFYVTEYEREAIRPHVLGKFRELLEATAKSPAMLFYLDNWQSAGGDVRAPRRARGLNENYGRELLELHTLGVDGGYTQKDVTEVARCFTGWTINRPQQGGSFLFAPRLHDRGEKVVLGAAIPAGGGIEDGERVLDLLARHPSTAKFISTKLAQRFVADEPPGQLVERMAKTFRQTDGDLRAVMKTMLDSKEFWSEGAYRSKLKSPFETVASAARAANAEVEFAFPLANQVAQMGQPLYRKQEPTGYSNSSKEWLNSAGLLARMNFAVQLASGKIAGVKVEAADAAALGSPEFQKR
jgi:uncharacterized protein (DUF1800 family)